MKSASNARTPTAWTVAILTLTCWQIGCSRSAQSYIERGNRYYSEGKYEEAALNYRSSIQRTPNLAEAHYRLALVEEKQGGLRDPYDELQRALSITPSRDDIRVELADLALRSYSASQRKAQVFYDEVVKTTQYLLKKDPNSFDGLRLQADTLAIDGKLDEALGTFRRANGIKPLEPSLIVPMLQVLLHLNQAGEADALAKQFFQRHEDFAPAYDVLLTYFVQTKRTTEAEALLKSEIDNMPNDPSPILQLAGLYRQLQREPEMVKTLQMVLNDPKKFPDGHAAVGDFYARNGRLDDAIREYQSGLLSSTKQTLNYQKKIARLLVTQGKRDEAIEQLNQVLKESPDDSDSHLARAILLRESSDPKKLDLAMSELNSLIEKAPNDEIAHYNLGLAYLAKGDANVAKTQLKESARLRRAYIPPRKALAEIDQRERNYSESIRLAEEILAVNPDDADARLLHAGGLIGNKTYLQARNELGALLRQYPNSTNINLHMAVLDTAEKRYRDAEGRYHQLYKPGDKDLRPLEGLIQLHMAEKRPDKALTLLDQELRLSPDSRPLRLLSASIATAAGKLDLAMQQYKWLQANDPKSAEVYESLGEFYQLRGDVNSALASYQKARDLVPNDPKILAMLVFLQSASGNQTEAITNVQKQLALNPQDTIAMNNLAFMLADTSTDLDRALTLAQTAQRKAPSNPGIADTVGWVYVKKGLNDSAIQIFNGLVKRYPDQAAFRYHLGVALLQKGQAEEAKAEFLISLSKNPPKDMAEKIKQILSKLG
jgi:tetratricopeptide (TPR) repeat protein